MKKLLASVMALLTLVSMAGASAFTASPQRPNATQFELLSISAVDIPSTATGVRDYFAMVDSARVYKDGDVVTLAVKMRVKNIAKQPYTLLETVADKDIKLSISSGTADLSYAAVSMPVIVTDVYGGFTDMYVPNMLFPGYAPGVALTVLDAGRAMGYSKSSNSVSMTLRGQEKTSANFFDAASMSPYIADGKVIVAALKAKDGKDNFDLQGKSISYDFAAPDHVDYTIILAGVSKSAAKGDLAARMTIGSADRFSTGSIPSLAITDKYTIYKQVVKGSDAEAEGELATSTNAWVQLKGKYVAQVNPKSKDGSMNPNWAGGLTIKDGDLLTTKVYKDSSGKTLGENGIAVYTIADSEDRLIVSLVSEHTFYDGDAAKSIAMFEPDTGYGYARRLTAGMGGAYSYADGGEGVVANASKITAALNYFGLDTGINATYKLTDSVFEAKGNIIAYTQTVDATYLTTAIAATPTPTPKPTPKPTKKPEIDVPVEDDEIEVPKTGDFTAETGGAIAIAMLGAAAAIAFALKRRLQK